jgi:hypothetical protein
MAFPVQPPSTIAAPSATGTHAVAHRLAIARMSLSSVHQDGCAMERSMGARGRVIVTPP